MDELKELESVTRVEVISDKGRDYVNWQCRDVRFAVQDDGRTLKIFLKGRPENTR